MQCRRNDRIAKNVEIAMMGWRRRIRPIWWPQAFDKALQELIFGPFWVPNSARKQKVEKMVCKKINNYL